jgi:predicted nucleotidyltransferase
LWFNSEVDATGERALAKLSGALHDLYGARLDRLVLFGSRARDDARCDSDIDVLVVLGGNVHPSREIDRTGEIVSSVSLEYDTVISCVFVSSGRYTQGTGSLLANVRREGIRVG